MQWSSWLMVMPMQRSSNASHCSTEKLRRRISFIKTAITRTCAVPQVYCLPLQLVPEPALVPERHTFRLAIILAVVGLKYSCIMNLR